MHTSELPIPSELVADPKSPLGSAYAFGKPKQQAIMISNSSFILQFASARFVNNYFAGWVSVTECTCDDCECWGVMDFCLVYMVSDVY